MKSTIAVCLALWIATSIAHADDYIRQLQTTAIENDQSPIAHWGVEPDKYTQWGSHSNRLIPIYTFGTLGVDGIDLESYIDEHSPYRNEAEIQSIYGFLPTDSVNESAVWCDQTNLYDLQHTAIEAGKKHIILVIFDGMDWQTTQAAAIYHTGEVTYDSGRGHGLHFQDYTAEGTTQFGYMVTSPHNDGTSVNVDTQTVLNPGGAQRGGFNAARGGDTPWLTAPDLRYLIGQPADDVGVHAYTDSSSSATSMTAGIKTYNNGVNVDAGGTPVMTIAHEAQDRGYAVGVVTSVPVSHATPACAYAHNVHRDDYQDLTRDLLGLPSISHGDPLSGMDLVIGAGYGVQKETDQAQGENFVPGNRYLADADLLAIDVEHGGRYVVSQRTPGVAGGSALKLAAMQAAESHSRLFGYYGVGSHLPFRTADGDYQPAPGRADAEVYTPEDLNENPTLAEMTTAALTYMEAQPEGFWLMVEAGDVDWANHDNNLDNSIGAVLSGDAAVKNITDWVEANSNWDETVLIVTADHGHYLVLVDPTGLLPPVE